MTDINTQNATQQQNTTQPEGNGAAGKMFTQEEVNNIVRERLARERAKGQTEDAAASPTQDTDHAERNRLEAEKEQLAADRRRFENECYCKESGISTDIIDILGDIDPAAFKEKTEKLKKAFSKSISGAGATVLLNSGTEHGGTDSVKTEPAGAKFFKPSSIYY